MPLYEYQCKQCGRHTEKIQKFSDPELTVCPHCGGALERTLTAPAVQFKGGGWYKDLYSSPKPAAAAATGDAAKPVDSANSSAKPAESTASTASSGSSSSSPSSPAPSASPASTSKD